MDSNIIKKVRKNQEKKSTQKKKEREIVNIDDYEMVYLVGNQYCEHKPSKKDKDIRFIPEDNNMHDSNAVKVLSIRDNKEYKLGYIGKLYTEKIRENINKIKIYKILKKNNGTENPYYHILYTLTKYPIY